MTLTAGVCDGALKRAWGSETWQWHICAGAIRGAQKSATKALKGALKIRPPAVAGKNPNYTDTCGNTQNLPPVSLDFRVPNGTPTSTKDTTRHACWGPIWDPVPEIQRHGGEWFWVLPGVHSGEPQGTQWYPALVLSNPCVCGQLGFDGHMCTRRYANGV